MSDFWVHLTVEDLDLVSTAIEGFCIGSPIQESG